MPRFGSTMNAVASWKMYCSEEEGTRLNPPCELADYLACAAMELEEAMMCEHDDYDDASRGDSHEL